MQKKPALLTIKDSSKLLGISTKTLRRWEKSGKIQATRTAGGHRRFLLEDVNRLKKKKPQRQIHNLLSIENVSKDLGVSSKTIRRWEKEGKIESMRTVGGHRRFTTEAIQQVKNKKYQPVRPVKTISIPPKEIIKVIGQPLPLSPQEASILSLFNLKLISFVLVSSFLILIAIYPSNVELLIKKMAGIPIPEEELVSVPEEGDWLSILSAQGGLYEGDIGITGGVEITGSLDVSLTTNTKDLIVSSSASIYSLSVTSGLVVSGNEIINSSGKIPALNGDYFEDLDGENITNVDAHHLGGAAASSFLRSDQSDTAGATINFTATPGSTDVNGGPVYINPAASVSDYTLFGIALNGSQRFKVDAEGDVSITGDTTATGDLTVSGTIYGNGSGISGVTASSMPFSGITSATNTIAAMVVGNGASLTYSGTGTITASDLTCTDCLDFTEFADSLTLDANTDIALDALTYSTSGTGALDYNSTGQVSFAGNINAENGLDVTTADLTVGGASFFSVAQATGNITTAGDLAVNGENMTSSTAAFNLLNATPTTLNIGGAATTVSLGAATGTTTINNATTVITGNLDVNGSTNDIAGTLNLSGGALTSTGALTITPQANNNLNIVLATTGDFVVNADDLVVDTSEGRVGIGTTTPTNLLDVGGVVSSSFTGVVNIAQTHTSAYSTTAMSANGETGLYIQNTNNSSNFSSLRLSTRESQQSVWEISNVLTEAYVGDLTFKSRTGAATYSEQVRITSSGKVGIGTTDPGNKLDVRAARNSGIQLIDDTTGTEAITLSVQSALGAMYGGGAAGRRVIRSANDDFIIGTLDAKYLALGTNNTERMRILSGGNVGIGTTGPGALLEVSSDSDTKVPEIRITDTDTTAGSSAPSLTFYDTSTLLWAIRGTDSQGLLFRNSSDAIVMALTDSGDLQMDGDLSVDGAGDSYITGNVGIGTTNPGAKLEVYGAGQLTADLTDAGVRTDMLALNSNTTSTNSGGAIVFGNIQSVAADSIGMAAIKGLLASGAGNTTGSIAFSTRYSTADTALTERMRIDNLGNVGIGRTSATNVLEVEGTASKTDSGDWLVNSDIRIKRDVLDLENALDIIDLLRPVKFKYTDEYMEKHPSLENRYYYNFIAQEFQEVFPDSVKDSGENGILQLDSYNVRPYLVAAMQELNTKVNALELDLESGLVLGLDSELEIEAENTEGEETEVEEETNTEDTEEVIDNILARIDSLETEMLLLNSSLNLTSPSETTDSSFLTSLTVLGNSVLGDTVINGRLNIGILSFDNLAGSIDAIGPLKLQSLALAPIEFVGGAIEMDQDGNLDIKKGQIHGNDSFRGKITLEAGKDEVEVEKNWEKTPLTVVVTPTYTVAISISKVDENGFIIRVEKPPEEDAEIHWMALW